MCLANKQPANNWTNQNRKTILEVECLTFAPADNVALINAFIGRIDGMRERKL